MDQSRLECDTGKVCYRSFNQANVAAQEIMDNPARFRDFKGELRSYKCPMCKWWHHSSQYKRKK